jgi:lysine N6-hydroxylase
MKEKIYDVAGIGIGPFNLGFAALSENIHGLDCIFFERNESFNWHPGMMLDFAKMQVPFYADLVTGADPCNKYSFLSYLKQNSRLYQFAIKDEHYTSRYEYNDYCQWVCRQLTSLRFGYVVDDIYYDEVREVYEIHVTHLASRCTEIYFSKKLLAGTGTQAFLPPFLQGFRVDNIIHSCDYLFNKTNILQKESVVIIGSGQSAAEIFYDLLQQFNCFPGGIRWVTSAGRLFPMDVSKFSCEMSTPDYINHFFHLEQHIQQKISRGHQELYKGINQELIADIYRVLYERSTWGNLPEISILPNGESAGMEVVNGDITLEFYHRELNEHFMMPAGFVIAATGYRAEIPASFKNINGRIKWRKDGLYDLYDVGRNYSTGINEGEIYVQNAEMHTHGFSSADLGMGPYRNAVIINDILGYEHYAIEKNVCFQEFGWRNSAGCEGFSQNSRITQNV